MSEYASVVQMDLVELQEQVVRLRRELLHEVLYSEQLLGGLARVREMHRGNKVTLCCPHCGRAAPCETWTVIAGALGDAARDYENEKGEE